MGKGSSPPPPDYAAAAEATAQGQQEVTSQQTTANRPDVYTPWGSQTWKSSAGTDPATGKPVTNWTGNLQLTPDQQKALNDQMAIQSGRSDAAKGLLGQATDSFSKPFDWGGLPEGSGPVQAGQLNSGPVNAGNIQTGFGGYGGIQNQMSDTAGGWRQTAQDAVTKLQQPGLDRARAMTETQLSNQGITRGSDAWKEQMQMLGDNEARAGLMGIAAGRDEANAMFGQDLASSQFGNQAQAQGFGQSQSQAQFGNQSQQQNFQQMLAQAMRGDSNTAQQLQMDLSAGGFNNANRQQSLAEMQQRRTMPLNELNALLTGQQVQNPNMPSFSQAGKGGSADMLGAASDDYSGALDIYGTKQAQKTGNTQAAAGLASAALIAFSDARLKSDIRWLDTLPNGIELYSYKFPWSEEREVGVLAQEVQEIMPHAVIRGSDGYLRVNYSEVLK